MASIQGVSHMTVLVRDMDRALDWYTQVLGCEKRGDQMFPFGDQQVRWLTVGFPGNPLEIVLSAPMPTPGRDSLDEPGNGTMTVLAVDDCEAVVEAARAAGATISAEPEEMPWGISAIIRDPDGNPFNLVQSPLSG